MAIRENLRGLGKLSGVRISQGGFQTRPDKSEFLFGFFALPSIKLRACFAANCSESNFPGRSQPPPCDLCALCGEFFFSSSVAALRGRLFAVNSLHRSAPHFLTRNDFAFSVGQSNEFKSHALASIEAARVRIVLGELAVFRRRHANLHRRRRLASL